MKHCTPSPCRPWWQWVEANEPFLNRLQVLGLFCAILAVLATIVIVPIAHERRERRRNEPGEWLVKPYSPTMSNVRSVRIR